MQNVDVHFTLAPLSDCVKKQHFRADFLFSVLIFFFFFLLIRSVRSVYFYRSFHLFIHNLMSSFTIYNEYKFVCVCVCVCVYFVYSILYIVYALCHIDKFESKFPIREMVATASITVLSIQCWPHRSTQNISHASSVVSPCLLPAIHRIRFAIPLTSFNSSWKVMNHFSPTFLLGKTFVANFTVILLFLSLS